MQVFKLTPSDFAFAYEECKRCFFLKIVEGLDRPRPPMPARFTTIDAAVRRAFAGRRMSDIQSDLPDAILRFDEKWVESVPMLAPGRTAACRHCPS
jgi:hypothetical protein